MKKLVAFILVLALCLSLCSVAFATPAPEAPSSCNINILHAIGAYWIARTIVERAKEVEVETVNLSDFLKWALPVGIAAVGTAAAVHFFYHLLKDCGGNTEDSNFTVTFENEGDGKVMKDDHEAEPITVPSGTECSVDTDENDENIITIGRYVFNVVAENDYTFSGIGLKQDDTIQKMEKIIINNDTVIIVLFAEPQP